MIGIHAFLRKFVLPPSSTSVRAASLMERPSASIVRNAARSSADQFSPLRSCERSLETRTIKLGSSAGVGKPRLGLLVIRATLIATVANEPERCTRCAVSCDSQRRRR